VQTCESARLLFLHYWSAVDEVLIFLCFLDQPAALTLEIPPGPWRKLLDSSSARWGGEGGTLPDELQPNNPMELRFPARSLAVFHRAMPGHA
jgi:hypothetical protein